MRRAEYVMAGIMAAFSLYLMWKSTELPIGWIPQKGPGGGAFSFWLALGMLICCAIIAWRTYRRSTPESRSNESYMDKLSLKLFLIAAGSLAVMVGVIHFVGVYVAIPLFFIFYIRFVGRHSWVTTGALALATPVVTFFFFEIGLKILLPKGVTEPLFYPLYEAFL
ncbi:MAG: tripartite tricarboxylate transporter TctB family protein [Kiloniellales bacterium]|nr:tripartite tricarboxylate transporter TctB family protein [Kiloniellales bacterium]